MNSKRDVDSHWSALARAALAIGAGCGLLVMLGAPSRMPIMNGAILAVALLATGMLAHIALLTVPFSRR